MMNEVKESKTKTYQVTIQTESDPWCAKQTWENTYDVEAKNEQHAARLALYYYCYNGTHSYIVGDIVEKVGE